MNGAVLTEINSSGQKGTGYVYAGSNIIAKQVGSIVIWEHQTPANTSKFEIQSNNGIVNQVEFDPVGADVGLTEPLTQDTNGGDGDIGSNHAGGGDLTSQYADMFNPSGGCVVNGWSTSCSEYMAYINFGTGQSTSFLDNASTTMDDIATSIPLRLALPGVSKVSYNVSGTTGTSGYETIEQSWSYAEGYGWYYGPTPTSYSGIAATPMSVVSLATNVAVRQTQQTTQENTFPIEHLQEEGETSYGNNGRKAINQVMQDLISSDTCAKAFKAMGLGNPFWNFMKNGGIVFGPASLLNNAGQRNLDYMGITEDARQGNLQFVNSPNHPAFTIRDRPDLGKQTTDGRPRIFLNTKAFESYSLLRETIVHELIHVAGMRGKDGWPHDLSWMGWKYTLIIKACT